MEEPDKKTEDPPVTLPYWNWNWYNNNQKNVPNSDLIMTICIFFQLDLSATNLNTTTCRTTHLTAFGAFYVAPNPILIPTFALLKHGYVLMIVVAIINILYIIGLIILRRFDHSDKLKVCDLIWISTFHCVINVPPFTSFGKCST